MHKSESHLARTQKPSLMQVVPLHLTTLYFELRPHYYTLSSCFTPHIYITSKKYNKKKVATPSVRAYVHKYPIPKVDEEKSAYTVVENSSRMVLLSASGAIFSWSIGWKPEMHEAWKERLNIFFSLCDTILSSTWDGEMSHFLPNSILLATAGWCTSLNKMHHDLSEGKVLSLHKSSFSFLFFFAPVTLTVSAAVVVAGKERRD